MCPCRGQLGGFPAVMMVPQKAAERKTAKSLIKSSTYTIPLRKIRSFPQLSAEKISHFFLRMLWSLGLRNEKTAKSLIKSSTYNIPLWNLCGKSAAFRSFPQRRSHIFLRMLWGTNQGIFPVFDRFVGLESTFGTRPTTGCRRPSDSGPRAVNGPREDHGTQDIWLTAHGRTSSGPSHGDH